MSAYVTWSWQKTGRMGRTKEGGRLKHHTALACEKLGAVTEKRQQDKAVPAAEIIALTSMYENVKILRNSGYPLQ